MKIKVALAIITLVFMSSLLVAIPLLISQRQIPNQGNLVTINIGVFTDALCTNNCTSLDWGSITYLDTHYRTVYFKNTGSAPITVSYDAINWSPAGLNNNLTLAWNWDGRTLAVGESAPCTFSLNYHTNSTDTAFTFTIIVTGTEVT